MTEYSERLLTLDHEGWYVDLLTGEYPRLDADATVAVSNRWLYDPDFTTPEPKKWDWWERHGGRYLQPGELGDGSYIDRHPSRYDDTWIPAVEEVARYMVDNFNVWVNTYVDHPPGFGGIYDALSLDIWGPNGRGDGSHREEVNAAGAWCFNNMRPPWINWYIREGWIWISGVGWQQYWDNDSWSDAGHWNHLHITFFHYG